MEYHVNGIDDNLGDPTHNITTTEAMAPSMMSAVAEGVYALGRERNPNIVKLACFAPIMQHTRTWR